MCVIKSYKLYLEIACEKYVYFGELTHFEKRKNEIHPIKWKTSFHKKNKNEINNQFHACITYSIQFFSWCLDKYENFCWRSEMRQLEVSSNKQTKKQQKISKPIRIGKLFEMVVYDLKIGSYLKLDE